MVDVSMDRHDIEVQGAQTKNQANLVGAFDRDTLEMMLRWAFYRESSFVWSSFLVFWRQSKKHPAELLIVGFRQELFFGLP